MIMNEMRILMEAVEDYDVDEMFTREEVVDLLAHAYSEGLIAGQYGATGSRPRNKIVNYAGETAREWAEGPNSSLNI